MTRPCQILGDEYVCPDCKAIIERDIDVGDGFLHDVCLWCGFKRKRKIDAGTIVKAESK